LVYIAVVKLFACLLLMLGLCLPIKASDEQRTRKTQADVVRTTICEVVSSPGLFDGKTIELRAAVLAGLETNTLYDKSCLQGQLPSRILFITDEQVERNSDYQKFWNLVKAYRKSKDRRRSITPDKYSVTATFIGRFTTRGTTGHLITSHGIISVTSVRDVVAHPFDGRSLTDAKPSAKQPGNP
jgi:hypothetical protein